MKRRKDFYKKFRILLATGGVLISHNWIAATAQPRAQLTTLHKFQAKSSDGIVPRFGSLILDVSGNLYGTTEEGGTGTCPHGCGTVFELEPQQGGGWKEGILYSFQNNGADGIFPITGLVLDDSGNLYGTTFSGGTGSCTKNGTLIGCGTAFELSPLGGGVWKESVLHSFQADGVDGVNPAASLVLDAAGNLYGTTSIGGGGNCSQGGCGVVFELSPLGGGQWSEAILHSFQNNGTDGYYILSRLLFDGNGNLYGTTGLGGSDAAGCNRKGCGTIFELSPQQDGGWAEAILYSFRDNGTDGTNPNHAGLIFDAVGNLYGTAVKGGSYGLGVVYELMPQPGGSWDETIIYSFAGTPDGKDPDANLAIDTSGNLYSVADEGGTGICSTHGCGGVFRLSPQQGGGWAEKLVSFSGKNGLFPEAGVVLDSAGNIYGTTEGGGNAGCKSGCGTVFEITQ